MKRSMRTSWFLAMAVVAGLGVSAKAGPLDDRVPQDSIFYFGWAGADTLGPQYANSNLKGVLDASKIPDFIGKQFPKLMDLARAQDPNAPQIIAKIQQGLNVAWRHPTAFYFCPLDFTNPQMPGFRFGLICDAGADAKPTVDLLNQALAQAPQNPFLPIKVLQDGTTVMITFGKADTLADLKQGGGLAAAPAYKTAMAKVNQPAPALATYFDMAKAMTTLNDALAKIPSIPPDVKTQIPAMIDSMGYGALTQVATVGGFDGKGWSQKSVIGINGPKKGFVALMDNGPLSDAVMALVPKEAAAFAAWKLDLQKVFTETRNLQGKINANGQRQFDQGVAAVGQNLGLNVEKDLLAPLGNEWVFYRAPLSDEGGNSPAFVTKLKDGATFAKSLAKLEGLINAIPSLPIKIEKVTAAQTQVSTLAFMQYSVAWGVKNDTFYISSLGGIGGAIKQVENKLPSILENPDYKAARAALPANARPLSISYSNPAKLYPDARRAALGFFPLARQNGIDIPMDLLPETDAVAKFMPPGAAMMWSEADGIHAAGKDAFPGSELLGGQTIVPALAAGGLSAGISLMPQLANTGLLNVRSADMANLRGISQSALVYAADHKDAMPDDLARLVAEGMVAPGNLVTRRSGTTPLQMTPELDKMAKDDFAKFAGQVAAHSDFVYLGKDTKSEVNAGVIVAYEKPSAQTNDGLNIAFQDAHAEFIPWPRMAATFEATNAFLKKNNKPQVDVKSLMRAAGVLEEGAGLP